MTKKITELTTATTLEPGDYVPIVDQDGTPTTKKITALNFGDYLYVDTTKAQISQSAHGFVAGDVLYYNGTVFAKAQANALSTSKAVCVVESATTDAFVAVFSGRMTTPTLTAGTVYYLSDATAGLLTSTAPTSASSFLVQVLVSGTTTVGYVKIGEPLTLALIDPTDIDIPKNNFAAVGAPTTGDDTADGYSVGSRWIIPGGEEYVCVSASSGAANWKQTTGEAGPDATAPTLVSATVDTTGDVLTLIFSEAVTIGTDDFDDGLTITTDGDPTTATYVSGTGTTTIVYSLSATVNDVDTLTLDYTQPGDGIQDAAGNVLATIADEAIVNNSTQGADVTAPTVTSRVVGTSGDTLTLGFSEAVVAGTDGFSTGFVITTDGAATTATYASGTGTSSLVYNLSDTVQAVDTLTLAYTQPGDGVQDAAGNVLANFSGAAITNNSTQGSTTLDTDLVGYWKLDEASGNRADSKGSTTLTDNATVGSSTGKVYSLAADFEEANSEFLSAADNAAVSLGSDTPLTICAWVKLESKPFLDCAIVGKTGSSIGNTADTEYYLCMDNAGLDRFTFRIGNNTSSAVAVANTLGSPSTGTWYFIVAQHDPVANTVGISVNNGTMDTASWSGGTFDGSSLFRIGALSVGTRYMDGLIESVGIWKRVLSGTERTTLFNGGAGKSYPF